MRLANGYSDLVAIAVRDPAQVGETDVPLLQDNAAEGPGRGLIAGLQLAKDSARGQLLTIPADMPFLPDDLLDRLIDGIDSNGCAIAASGDHPHPVSSLWQTDVLGRVPEYLATGRRSLRGLAELVGHSAVNWPGGASDPFFNINTEADLAEAERRLHS